MGNRSQCKYPTTTTTKTTAKEILVLLLSSLVVFFVSLMPMLSHPIVLLIMVELVIASDFFWTTSKFYLKQPIRLGNDYTSTYFSPYREIDRWIEIGHNIFLILTFSLLFSLFAFYSIATTCCCCLLLLLLDTIALANQRVFGANPL